MGRSRSRSRSRSRERSRHSRRRRDRSRSRDRSRDRSRSRDRKRRRHRKRRSTTRSPSPPRRRSSSIAVPSPQQTKNEALSSLLLGTDQTGDPSMVGNSLPADVKNDLCVKDWDPDKMTGAALRWVTEQVAEQIKTRTKELDEVVRDKVAKAKIDLEVRLRAQIEQEWKEEIEAARKREQESMDRVRAMEQSLAEKLQDVENEKAKLNEERLRMLESKSKLEMEKHSLQSELDQMKKNEQHAILNKGGGQRAPIRISFGGGK